MVIAITLTAILNKNESLNIIFSKKALVFLVQERNITVEMLGTGLFVSGLFRLGSFVQFGLAPNILIWVVACSWVNPTKVGQKSLVLT